MNSSIGSKLGSWAFVCFTVSLMMVWALSRASNATQGDGHGHGSHDDHSEEDDTHDDHSEEHDTHDDHSEEHDTHDDHSKEENHSDHKEETHNPESEFHVNLSETSVELGEIELSVAKNDQFVDTVQLFGVLVANQNRNVVIKSRREGQLIEVRKQLGSQVKPGDLLAVVEANGSLAKFRIESPIAGEVINKDAQPGEFASISRGIFEIQNFDSVWLDLIIPSSHFNKVTKGLTIEVTSELFRESIQAKINYVSPVVNSNSQGLLARAVLNSQQKNSILRIGDSVKAIVLIPDEDSTTLVNESAVQTLENDSVIFVPMSETSFVAKKVTLGKKSRGTQVILAGIRPGEKYVSKNSFILKAELQKSLAGHQH